LAHARRPSISVEREARLDAIFRSYLDYVRSVPA
jgi:hypothetical protein